jgi:hypothetical protein
MRCFTLILGTAPSNVNTAERKTKDLDSELTFANGANGLLALQVLDRPSRWSYRNGRGLQPFDFHRSDPKWTARCAPSIHIFLRQRFP